MEPALALDPGFFRLDLARDVGEGLEHVCDRARVVEERFREDAKIHASQPDRDRKLVGDQAWVLDVARRGRCYTLAGRMTPEHVIFIPGILLVGIVVGYVFGSRAARSDIERKRKRARE